jgi:hypothetical protein
MNTASDMLNTIESVRAQIQAIASQVTNDPAMAAVRAGGDSLEQKFIGVERNIIDPRMTGRGQDAVRYPVKLGGQLDYLAGGIAASDFAPTSQQRAVGQVLAKQTRDTHAALRALVQGDLARFNALLRARGLKTIDVTMPAVVF